MKFFIECIGNFKCLYLIIKERTPRSIMDCLQWSEPYYKEHPVIQISKMFCFECSDCCITGKNK